MNNYNMILLTFVHLQIKFKIFENKHMHFHSFVKETQKHVCSIVKNISTKICSIEENKKYLKTSYKTA